MYLRTCESLKPANLEKRWGSQIEDPYLRKVRKSTKLQYLSPQIGVFAICGTYLRTAHLRVYSGFTFKLVREA
jgi:hypothetical protein